MPRSVSVVYAIALAVMLGWSAAVPAEPPSSSLQGYPKLPSQRRVMHPAPDPKVAERDAEDAAAAIEQHERDDELVLRELRGSRAVLPPD